MATWHPDDVSAVLKQEWQDWPRPHSTDIIGYTPKDEPVLLCPECAEHGEIVHSSQSDPYFEDDRQGDEICDVCLVRL